MTWMATSAVQLVLVVVVPAVALVIGRRLLDELR